MDVRASATAPRLLSVRQVADLLNVRAETVRGWIARNAIPYVVLPGARDRQEYRIPLQGLLQALSGYEDVAAEVEAAGDTRDSAESAEPSGTDVLDRWA